MPPQLPSNRPAVIQHIRKNSQLCPSAHNVSSPFHSGLFCWRVSAENMETLVFRELSSYVIVPSDCRCIFDPAEEKNVEEKNRFAESIV